MIFTFLLSLQVANAPLPQPLTETHMRDIGCVATLGLIANDQRRGMAPSIRFPNVMERGKKYAGIVGERVMAETGQSREVVRLAIMQSVEDQQARAITTDEAGGDAKACLASSWTDVCRCSMPRCRWKRLRRKTIFFALRLSDWLPMRLKRARAQIASIPKRCEGLPGSWKENTIGQQVDQYFPEESTGSAAYDAVLGAIAATTVGDLDKEKRKQLELAKSGGGLEALSEAEGEEKYQRCIFLGD